MPQVPLNGYNSKYSNFNDQQMFKYMSALNDNNNVPPVMPLGTTGNSLTVDGVKRHNFNTGDKDLLIMLCPSVAGIGNAIMWEYNTTSTQFEYVDSSIPNLSTTWKFQTDPPLDSGNLRASCRILNTNSGQYRKGIVRILSASSPLDLVFDLTNQLNLNSASSTAIRDAIKNSPKSKTYTAEAFSNVDADTDKQIISGPSSLIKYQSWSKFNTESISLGVLATQFIKAQQENYHMNNILILFEATGTGNNANNYEIVYGTQHKFRYPLDTLLGSLQKPYKTSEKATKTLTKVGEGSSDLKDVKTVPEPATGMPGVPSPTKAEVTASKQKAAQKAKAQPAQKAKEKKSFPQR